MWQQPSSRAPQKKDIVIPVKEIAEALEIPEGRAVRLKKEAYGLIAAPLCWYKRVCEVMAEAGFTRMESDPRCWVLHDESETKFEDKELERKRARTRH